MESPTDGYRGRIRRALKQGPRPMSVRDLAREMGEKHPHLRGTSYGGIRQYAEGKIRNPRVELLRAIAETLGVRPAVTDTIMRDAASRQSLAQATLASVLS